MVFLCPYSLSFLSVDLSFSHLFPLSILKPSNQYETVFLCLQWRKKKYIELGLSRVLFIQVQRSLRLPDEARIGRRRRRRNSGRSFSGLVQVGRKLRRPGRTSDCRLDAEERLQEVKGRPEVDPPQEHPGWREHQNSAASQIRNDGCQRFGKRRPAINIRVIG